MSPNHDGVGTGQTIALFLPNWVGDAVMATPAIRAIRKRYPPPTRLIGIMRPKMAELFAGCDWFDEKWLWEPKGRAPVLSDLRLVFRMRTCPVDLLVLFPNSLHSALLAFLGGARQRIGYVRDCRGWLLTGKVFPPRKDRKIQPRPMVESYLRLAEAVGCPPESPQLELHCTPEEKGVGEEIFRSVGFSEESPTVGLVYAGAQGPARRPPVEHYIQLAKMVVSQTQWQVLVVAGPDEREIASRICQTVSHSRVKTMVHWPRLGLSVAKACLARCRVVISPDSGPRHIAAALGKPVITLYGPTTPIWGANPTVKSIDLFVDLPCLGCLKPVCPYGHHKCMQELKPERVFEAFCSLIGQGRGVFCGELGVAA
jgi:heptosyltransferase-2